MHVCWCARGSHSSPFRQKSTCHLDISTFVKCRRCQRFQEHLSECNLPHSVSHGGSHGESHGESPCVSLDVSPDMSHVTTVVSSKADCQLPKESSVQSNQSLSLALVTPTCQDSIEDPVASPCCTVVQATALSLDPMMSDASPFETQSAIESETSASMSKNTKEVTIMSRTSCWARLVQIT